jgi:hypothetical protein
MAINWEQGFRKGRKHFIAYWLFISVGIGYWFQTKWHMTWYPTWDNGRTEPIHKFCKDVGNYWYSKFDPVLMAIAFAIATILGTIVILLLSRISRYFVGVKRGFTEE